MTAEELAELLYRALLSGDAGLAAVVARYAVDRYAGMEPGRPVGGTYYLYRTLRNLDLDACSSAWWPRPARRRGRRRPDAARGAAGGRRVPGPHRAAAPGDRDRDPAAPGRWTGVPRRWPGRCASPCPRTSTSCTPPATSWPPCAGPCTRSRASWPSGWPASAATAAGARSTSGPPCAARCRPAGCRSSPVSATPGRPSPRSSWWPTSRGRSPPSPASPCYLVHAISSQFSKVRSFVFVDGIDEVTRFFEGADDPAEAVHRINTEADVIWVDGHSDYGHALSVFNERWGDEVTPRTSVLVLGDARNNYHASEAWVLERAAAPGPPRLLAQPRAARLLGLGRLDRRRVRGPLRRRGRVPDAAPARAVRGRAGVSGPAPPEGPARPRPPARGPHGARPVARGHHRGAGPPRRGGLQRGRGGGRGDRLHGADRRRVWPRWGRWATGWPARGSWRGWPPSTPRCCLGRWPRPSCWPRPSTAGGRARRWWCDRLRAVRAAPRGGRRPHLARVRRPLRGAGLGRRPLPAARPGRGELARVRRAGLGSGGPRGRPPPGETVVVACHAGVIESTLLRFLPISPSCERLGLRTEHASLTVWERTEGRGCCAATTTWLHPGEAGGRPPDDAV